jgi:hypothetical protein
VTDDLLPVSCDTLGDETGFADTEAAAQVVRDSAVEAARATKEARVSGIVRQGSVEVEQSLLIARQHRSDSDVLHGAIDAHPVTLENGPFGTTPRTLGHVNRVAPRRTNDA